MLYFLFLNQSRRMAMPTTKYIIVEQPRPIMFTSNFSEYLGTVLSGDFNALTQWGNNERVDCFLPENIAEAMREIELILAEPDHCNFGNACLLRGYLYQYGQNSGVLFGGNREQAIDFYNQAIERGNSMAMVKLAEIYMSKAEAKIDYPQVLALLDQAIELENDHAMVERAWMHEMGSGAAAVNYDSAVALYERAINLGNAEAMCSRARMYEYGLGGGC